MYLRKMGERLLYDFSKFVTIWFLEINFLISRKPICRKAVLMEEESEMTAVEKVLGNSDLLTKILSLVLPPKQLIISKAVSNHWLTIISDPHLLLDYSRRLYASQPPSSLSQFYYFAQPISLHGSDETIPKIDCLEGIRQNIPTNCNLEILHSCNGLLLCRHGYATPLYVVNPTTKKHRLIPDPNGQIWGPKCFAFLAFDPSVSIHYKVVCFRKAPGYRLDRRWVMLNIPFEEIVVYIFSSEHGLWRRISLSAPPDWLNFSTRKVFWRGAIHGINCLKFHIQFHIEEERFSWIQTTIDPNTPPKSMRYYIQECDNGLLAIKLYKYGDFLAFDQNGFSTIYEMNKDSNLWAPKHEVNLKPLLSEFRGRGGSFTMLAFSNHVRSEANKETPSLVIAIPGRLILYSVKPENYMFTSKVLKEMQSFEGTLRDFHPYVQCLVPV